MPATAKSPCSVCGVLSDKRRCPKHDKDERKAFDAARRSQPHRRLYNTPEWKRVRNYIIGRDPLCCIADVCVEQDGHPASSQVVDHIVRATAYMAQGGNFFDVDNLQGACVRCHDAKTAREVGFAGAKL